LAFGLARDRKPDLDLWWLDYREQQLADVTIDRACRNRPASSHRFASLRGAVAPVSRESVLASIDGVHAKTALTAEHDALQ